MATVKKINTAYSKRNWEIIIFSSSKSTSSCLFGGDTFRIMKGLIMSIITVIARAKLMLLGVLQAGFVTDMLKLSFRWALGIWLPIVGCNNHILQTNKWSGKKWWWEGRWREKLFNNSSAIVPPWQNITSTSQTSIWISTSFSPLFWNFSSFEVKLKLQQVSPEKGNTALTEAADNKRLLWHRYILLIVQNSFMRFGSGQEN